MILLQAVPVVWWPAIGPELALSVGAAVVLLVDVQWKPATPRPLAWVVTAALAVSLGLSIWQWGRIEEVERLPFGGMVIVDRFGLLARFALTAVTALGVAGGWRLFERLGRWAAEGLALVLLSAAGFQLMGVSAHLILIFLGLEVGSISLYVLAGITREREDSDEAAIKYFLLGSVASAVFVYGVALTFAGTGELGLLGQRLFLDQTILTRPAVLVIGIALLVAGLAFKVSAAPFHAWAPDVYQGAPAGVVGYMAAAAKIGGFAALTRILFFAFPALDEAWAPVVAGIAALSMVLGSVVAIVQEDLRRLLAYSGVAHAGFILTGVVAGPAGTTGIWFYLVVYTVQLVGAFVVVAAVSGPADSRMALSAVAGLYRRQPFLALTFTVLLLGMGGIPLTSGFVAKFGVFQEAWRSGFEWLVIVAVVASVVAFFLYLRVVVAMYMEEGEEAPPLPTAAWGTRTVLAVAAVATIVLGLVPAPLLRLAGDAVAG